MTVCIAALCRDGENVPRVVIATDRMVTWGGFIEFEHTVPKMAVPSPTAVAMISGGALVGTRLAREVADSAAGTSPRVGELAETARPALRRDPTEEHGRSASRPRGLDLDRFYARQASLNPQFNSPHRPVPQSVQSRGRTLLAGTDVSGGRVTRSTVPGLSASTMS